MDLGRLNVGGVSLRILSPVPENLICQLCSEILENPHQAPCGCRFCFNCINQYLQNELMCPGKTEYCLGNEIDIERDLRPDLLALREMKKLIVKCPFSPCEKTCGLQEMKDHLWECRSSSVECKACHNTVIRTQYDSHISEECSESLMVCEACQQTLNRRLMKEEHHNYGHPQLCVSYSGYCPNHCGERNLVVWSDHRSVCSVKCAGCPFQVVGCPSIFTTMMDMPNHMVNHAFDHAEGVCKHIENVTNEMSCFNGTVEDVKNEIKMISTSMASNDNRQAILNNELINDLMSLRAEIEEMKVQIHRKDIELNRLNNDSVSIKTEMHQMKAQNQLKDAKINKLSNDSVSLKSDMQAMKVQNQIKDVKISELNNDNVNLKAAMQTMKTQTLLKDNEILKAKQESKEVKNKFKLVSKTIVCRWTIENFSQEHDVSGPDFYTHTMGYKMCVCITKRTRGYLSVYVNLMKGEYDDNLAWPFRKFVIVQIVDQESMGRDFERKFHFSHADGKRKYQNQISSIGYEEFITYQELKEKSYLLKHNRLLIHCVVDHDRIF